MLKFKFGNKIYYIVNLYYIDLLNVEENFSNKKYIKILMLVTKAYDDA